MRETAVSPGPHAGLILPLAAAGLVTVVGAALLLRPEAALLGILTLSGVAAVLIFARALPATFLFMLGIVLLGYALFGRSFAYLGAPPVFLGEILLVMGILATLASGSLLTVARSPVIWLVVLWAIWGAFRTVPFLATYGIDALRDATLWGYSVFAVTVAACVLSTRSVPEVARRYSGWVMGAALWLPAALLLNRWLGLAGPHMPGTDQLLFIMKPGDAGVHLAGIASFVLLGLGSSRLGRTADWPRHRWLFWGIFLFGLVCVTAMSRGGFLSVVATLLVVGLFEPIAVGKRLAIAALVVLLAAATVAVVSDNLQFEDAMSTAERTITPRQVIANIVSVGSGTRTRGNLSGTREWRLDWWTTITDYTVFGRYFWTGKGFGVNLADDDGFQVASPDEAPLRSPHSSVMTVLARTGVPGALLWAALQLCFGVSLVAASWRARAAGALWWARLDLWILSYWIAFVVNSSFDVFLEGPQGGIWFWCLIGLGVAVIELQRAGLARPQPRLAV
jgi:hypothetical protein